MNLRKSESCRGICERQTGG